MLSTRHNAKPPAAAPSSMRHHGSLTDFAFLQRIRESRARRDADWAEFVRRIAQGDPAALEALLEETKPVVFGKALRILGLWADAEEITTDVYLKVWRSAGRYSPHRGSVFTWLMNITSSRAIDRLRASHERRCEVALSFESGNTIDPATNAACYETRDHVRQALELLPVEQRRAIELSFFSGYSMAEIASQLGHPLGTVKTRIRLGLIGLRCLIAPAANAIHPKSRQRRFARGLTLTA